MQAGQRPGAVACRRSLLATRRHCHPVRPAAGRPLPLQPGEPRSVDVEEAPPAALSVEVLRTDSNAVGRALRQPAILVVTISDLSRGSEMIRLAVPALRPTTSPRQPAAQPASFARANTPSSSHRPRSPARSSHPSLPSKGVARRGIHACADSGSPRSHSGGSDPQHVSRDAFLIGSGLMFRGETAPVLGWFARGGRDSASVSLRQTGGSFTDPNDQRASGLSARHHVLSAAGRPVLYFRSSTNG